MKIRQAMFYSKLDKETTTKTVQIKLQEPTIQAKSWYQMNTNHSLENIITFRGNIDDFRKFNAVQIGDRTYYLTGLTANGDKSLRGEIGI